MKIKKKTQMKIRATYNIINNDSLVSHLLSSPFRVLLQQLFSCTTIRLGAACMYPFVTLTYHLAEILANVSTRR